MQINKSHSVSEQIIRQNSNVSGPGNVLKMIKNERMGGYVPSWQPAVNEQDRIEAQMSNAIQSGAHSNNLDNALALQPNATLPKGANTQEFGFGDLIDMINPLHHIPLVGSAYRAISGDEIRPVSRLIGGGVFGGVIGAASGLVNIIAQEATGQDLAENAYSFVAGKPTHPVPMNTAQISPEENLNMAFNAVGGAESALPASALAFTAQTPSFRNNLAATTIEQKVAFRSL